MLIQELETQFEECINNARRKGLSNVEILTELLNQVRIISTKMEVDCGSNGHNQHTAEMCALLKQIQGLPK